MLNQLKCPSCQAVFDTEEGSSEFTCPRCDTFVDPFGEDTASGDMSAATIDLDVDSIEIGGYKIVGELGRGGMGIVLEGWQISLQRRVAIKILAPELVQDAQFVDRFQREATALASFSHPNIVSVIEKGRVDDYMYFVMEYLGSDEVDAPADLREVLLERKLTVTEVADFTGQVAAGLSAAHKAGVVHRDIKPGNLMIDRYGKLKVADFGIASVNMVGKPEEIQLTMPNVAMGTFDYMAPEQRDDASSVDGRVDIYSLGVIVYEMLTGTLPRGAYTPASHVIDEVTEKWDELILRALKPNPDDRFGSMREFSTALRDILSETEVPAGHQCLNCGSVCQESTEFCPQCGTDQFITCGSCHERVQVHFEWCQNCGSSLRKQLSIATLQELLQESRKITADHSLSVEERFAAAAQTGIAARRARNSNPDDAEIAELGAVVDAEAVALGVSAAKDARHNNRFCVALECLESVLEIDQHHAEATRLQNLITAMKKRRRLQIDHQLAQGHISNAIELLQEFAQIFPSDRNLATELELCRSSYERIVDTVRSKFPILVKQGAWFSLAGETRQLETLGLKVKGLVDFQLRIDRQFAKIKPVLDEIESSVGTNDWKHVWELVQLSKGIMLDHPRISEIEELVDKKGTVFQSSIHEANELLENGRWFQVSELFMKNEMGSTDPTYQELITHNQQKIESANRYIALLVCCVAGGLVFFISDFLAVFFSDGVVDAVSYEPSLVRQISYMSSFIIINTASILVLVRFFNDQVGKGHFWGAAGLWLGGTAIPVFVSQYAVGPEVLLGPVALLVATIIMGLAMCLLVADLFKDLPSRLDYLCWTILILGPMIVAPTFFDIRYVRFILPSIYILSWLILSGQISTISQILPVVCLAAALSFVCSGLESSGNAIISDYNVWIGSLIFAGFVIMLTKGRWYIINSIVVITAVLVIESKTNPLLVCLAFWLAVMAALAIMHSDFIDFRLHLADRLSLLRRSKLVRKAS
jgi:serine/threonine protein kinase